MNFLKQITIFHDRNASMQLSANSQALYYSLLNINNKCGWIEEFSVANTLLCAMLGISSSALIRAREELIKNELLLYKSAGGKKAGTYRIVELEPQKNSYSDTQPEHKAETNRTQSGTLYKINKTNVNKTYFKKEKSNIKKGPLNNYTPPPLDYDELTQKLLIMQNKN